MIGGMGRWEPNARGRLEQAALELYVERGFEQTTVAEIAERAGLTERTFFRYFADKREVLFAGADTLRDLMVGALAGAPEPAAPIEAVAAALQTAGVLLQERREYARQRQAVIAGNAGLQERELIKLASQSGKLPPDVLKKLQGFGGQQRSQNPPAVRAQIRPAQARKPRRKSRPLSKPLSAEGTGGAH